ncbi:unnamed protein product [Prorocentrum cordatum]|uniref:Uncharacterized protein n=1 Tax=Prorocentrum cordatum TaxID=2364126 RepID=A0ABN9X075_9DINO|nr:unnamed protein product [Polarella glacialis]
MQSRERSKSRDPWNKGDKDTVNQLVAKIAPATPEVARSEAFKHVYVKAPPAEQKDAVNKHRKDIKEKIRNIGILIKAAAAADRPANDADCKEIAVLKYMLTESSGSENQLSEVKIQLEKEQGHLREIQQKGAEVRERRIQIEKTIRNIQETIDQLTKSKDEGGTAESADTDMHNAEEGVGRAPGNPHAGLGREASASSAAPKAAAAGHAAPAVPESSREMDSIKECLQRLTAAQMQQQNQQEAMMRQIGNFHGHLMDEAPSPADAGIFWDPSTTPADSDAAEYQHQLRMARFHPMYPSQSAQRSPTFPPAPFTPAQPQMEPETPAIAPWDCPTPQCDVLCTPKVPAGGPSQDEPPTIRVPTSACPTDACDRTFAQMQNPAAEATSHAIYDSTRAAFASLASHQHGGLQQPCESPRAKEAESAAEPAGSPKREILRRITKKKEDPRENRQKGSAHPHKGKGGKVVMVKDRPGADKGWETIEEEDAPIPYPQQPTQMSPTQPFVQPEQVEDTDAYGYGISMVASVLAAVTVSSAATVSSCDVAGVGGGVADPSGRDGRAVADDIAGDQAAGGSDRPSSSGLAAADYKTTVDQRVEGRSPPQKLQRQADAIEE